PRTICGLIGVNGSGKSTLFKALMGLVQPVRGSVRLFGLESGQSRKENLVTYVPQSEDVDWTFPVSVRDVVMMGRYGRLGPMRRPRRQDREVVEHALERVGLTELQHRQIGQLSGGQRKRAFVARGIAQEAALMLLDEPFAGVDKSSEAALVALFRELRNEGRTMLVSTHDLAGIPQLCDEAVLLHRRVLAHGLPEAVLTNENLARAFGTAAAPAASAPLKEAPGGIA
ncbi:metal ABC transporter ATP-binding protein, partial [Arthrobacter deserti]|nr:metal ABC transporter ATP-binding protein [Arthrobacter deserti]